MVRTPIEVYRGLVRTHLGDELPTHLRAVTDRFSEGTFAGQSTSGHLTRLLTLFCRFMAYLDSREVANLSDLTRAVDLLDYFASTSKWWSITRKAPGLVLRPPSHDPHEFMESLAAVQLGNETLSRIAGSTEKMSQYLEEHGIAESRTKSDLCESFASVWAVMSAIVSKSQGRTVTSENDFEVGYDVIRVLLFYSSVDDFKALTAIRTVGTNPKMHRAAGVSLAPGFERKLDSSAIARLERLHGESLSKLAGLTSGAGRSILTNSLRFLAQQLAVERAFMKVEEQSYESTIAAALVALRNVGIPSGLFQEESAVVSLFKSLKPSDDIGERIGFLMRRFEGLIADSAGSREFLLQHSRLVPQLVSLLLLLASGTKPKLEGGLQDPDLKRGLILLEQLLNDLGSVSSLSPQSEFSHR